MSMARDEVPRSKGKKRQDAMLAAAADVFLERGFAGATLDDVIGRAGGSRATLYQRFGNKEGLFAAIVADVCGRMVRPLSIAAGRDTATTLTDFAEAYMELLMAPRSLGLFRIVAAEGLRFPALAARVFAAGPETAAKTLAAYLRAEVKSGKLNLADADGAARLFLEMVKGDLHTRAVFGLEPAPSRQAMRRCLRSAVRLFLEGAMPR
jgi:AcrR family transcriptional regulator